MKKNGFARNILDLPLNKRKQILETLVFQNLVKGVIEIAEWKKASTVKEIKALLAEVVEARGEGVVVKNPHSLYVLGARATPWIKVKPGESCLAPPIFRFRSRDSYYPPLQIIWINWEKRLILSSLVRVSLFHNSPFKFS